MTTVFVTHDQHEALAVADRVGVMSNGRLEQLDPPRHALHPAAHAVRGRLHRHRQPARRPPRPRRLGGARPLGARHGGAVDRGAPRTPPCGPSSSRSTATRQGKARVARHLVPRARSRGCACRTRSRARCSPTCSRPTRPTCGGRAGAPAAARRRHRRRHPVAHAVRIGRACRRSSSVRRRPARAAARPTTLRRSAGELSARYRDAAGGRAGGDATPTTSRRTPRRGCRPRTPRWRWRSTSCAGRGFAPVSQLDLGTGLGSAVWAAADGVRRRSSASRPSTRWTGCWRRRRRGGDLGSRPRSASRRGGRGDAARLTPEGPFDLVTASYALNELPTPTRRSRCSPGLAADGRRAGAGRARHAGGLRRG